MANQIVHFEIIGPEPHALRVRMTGNYERARRLFSIARPELKNLKVSIDGMNSRIENSPDELRTEEDLAAFAASRANDLRLTAPRQRSATRHSPNAQRQ